MPREATARWPSKCSICGGDILYGDKIVTYSGEGKGSSKKTHHLTPGCSPYTLEPFVVDSQRYSLEYFVHCLEILKKINEIWAREEVAKIAMVDVSSDMFNHAPVEFHALRFLEAEAVKTETEISLIRRIANEALRVDIRKEAENILRDHDWES